MCTAGGVPNPDDNPFLANFIKEHEYTIEEKLINLCDLIALKLIKYLQLIKD